MSGTRSEFRILHHKGERDGYELEFVRGPVRRTWRLPSCPSLAEDDKRLAIEDGKYWSIDLSNGGQSLDEQTVWDSGGLSISRQSKRKIKFSLEGQRLSGSFFLLMPSWGLNTQNKIWLFFKVKG